MPDFDDTMDGSLTLSDISTLTVTGGPAGPGSGNWWLGANAVSQSNAVGSITFGPSAAQGANIYTSNGPASWNTNTTFNTPLQVDGKITATDLELDGVSMKEMMKTIQDRLAILVPDPKKLAKYEALKQAYDHYKTLEALIGNDDTPLK